jgi:hypothetical protein
MARLLKKRFGTSTTRHAVAELCRIDDRNGKPPLLKTGQRRRGELIVVARGEEGELGIRDM